MRKRCRSALPRSRSERPSAATRPAMPSPRGTRIFGQSSGSSPTATRTERSRVSGSRSIKEPPSAPTTPIAISSIRTKRASASTVRLYDSTTSWRAWSSSVLRSSSGTPRPHRRRAVSGETTWRSCSRAWGKRSANSVSVPASMTASRRASPKKASGSWHRACSRVAATLGSSSGSRSRSCRAAGS